MVSTSALSGARPPRRWIYTNPDFYDNLPDEYVGLGVRSSKVPVRFWKWSFLLFPFFSRPSSTLEIRLLPAVDLSYYSTQHDRPSIAVHHPDISHCDWY